MLSVPAILSFLRHTTDIYPKEPSGQPELKTVKTSEISYPTKSSSNDLTVLENVAHKDYFATHQTTDWSMQAVDLIDSHYHPVLMAEADAKYSKHQLIQFEYDRITYYAIFYIDKDGCWPGFLPKNIAGFHYNYADGYDTFITADRTAALCQMKQIRARSEW